MSGVFADTTPFSPKTTAVQTTSVDVVVLVNNLVPTMVIRNRPELSIPEVNFTTVFSFAPAAGFVRVTSVALNIISVFDTTTGIRPQNMEVIVGINGQSSGSLSLPEGAFEESATAYGFLNAQGLHPGSNIINIGLPVNAILTLYEAHLAVEYTFVA